MNTIVALYDDASTANQVIRELKEYGIGQDSIHLVESATTDVSSMLTQGGLPDDDARYYAEGVRQGGTLISIRTNEEDTDAAVDIMDRYQPVDVHERAAMWRKSGWKDEGAAYAQTQSSQRSADTARNRSQSEQGETKIPVVEEEIRVGKRQVAGGGVRVHTHVEEEPVEEQVRLREESVKVDRRPVNRPAEASELEAFQERDFEVSAVKEEAVVDKQARIVEEVVINKKVDEHTETIHDTVRHTEVDVEQTTGQPRTADFDVSRFRTHYHSNYANSGYTYEQYEPAYRYGSTLATNPRYQGREWNAIEADARTEWQQQHKESAWDRFKDAVRYSWEHATNTNKRGRR